MQSLTLNTGRKLPAVGLGLWKVARPSAADLVVEAARLGYRHFDSASDYGNEAEVGEGLRRVLEEGICPREELWITSKLWNTNHRAEHVRPAAERSLRDLSVDYLDLYLIHFPIALSFVPFETRYPAGWAHDPDAARPAMKPDRVPISETWEAMEELVAAGLVRDVGLCNFGTSLLRDLLSHAKIAPAVLQIELHPYLAQHKLVRFCHEQNIAVTAFSPLGAQSYYQLNMAEARESVLADSTIRVIAERHGRTPAQVVLRWGVQRGTSVVPKSMHTERLRENFALFDFKLSDEEMRLIEAMDRGRRFNDPGDFGESAFNTFFPIYE
ncbi:MAG: aldo/keto reductase [Planctomycetota bacterium]|nr:aldo/keto reductase [Planctomycetaceae bacterium]MDQ3330475.1 aldo/keto reductase [Planctomycetota bacterium]